MDGLTDPVFLGRLRPMQLNLTWWLVDYMLCLEAQAAYLFLTTPMSRGLGDVKNQIKFKITVTRYRKDLICGCIVRLNLSSFV